MKRQCKKKSHSQTPGNDKRHRRRLIFKSACAGLLGVGLSSHGAQGLEIHESIFAPSGDFSGEFPGDELPVSVTLIVGSTEDANEVHEGLGDDYFQLSGMAPGSQLTVVADSDNQYFFNLLDTEGNFISFGDGSDPNVTFAEVPADGRVIGYWRQGEGGIENNYTLAINAVYVPEPSTGTIAAVGAAALLGVTRRRKENGSD